MPKYFALSLSDYILTSICPKTSVRQQGFKNHFWAALGRVCMCYGILKDFLHHFTHAGAYLWSHPSAPRQISQRVLGEGASSCWQLWFSAGLATKWCAPPGGDKEWWSSTHSYNLLERRRAPSSGQITVQLMSVWEQQQHLVVFFYFSKHSCLNLFSTFPNFPHF